MGGQSACPEITRAVERFWSDLQGRYPPQAGMSQSRPVEFTAAGDAASDVRLRKLPPEIGVLLLVIGTAGVLLPGPVGSPFLVAGGIALWPAGFRKVERWLMKIAPACTTQASGRSSSS